MCGLETNCFDLKIIFNKALRHRAEGRYSLSGEAVMLRKLIKISIVSFFVALGVVLFLMSIAIVNGLYLTTGIKGGANGIFFDKNDRLYIGSVFGGAVHVMDTKTGEILETLGEEDGVAGPDDVEVAPNGDVYYTDILQGNICRRDIHGAVTKQHIATGVNSIAISKDGRVFVGMAVLGDSLYEVDRDLKKPPRLISGPRGHFNGSDFGPDGRLYTALNRAGKIISTNVDADNPATTELECDIKAVAADLPLVAGIKFNSKGEMYASTLLGNIWKIEPVTGEKELVANVCWMGIDNIAIDSKNSVFVSNTLNGRIYEVLPDGGTRPVNNDGENSDPT
jgi:sugar lactone lactonase YvrE